MKKIFKYKGHKFEIKVKQEYSDRRGSDIFTIMVTNKSGSYNNINVTTPDQLITAILRIEEELKYYIDSRVESVLLEEQLLKLGYE